MPPSNFWGPALLVVFGFVITTVYQTHHYDKRYEDLKAYIDVQVKRLEDRIAGLEARIAGLEARIVGLEARFTQVEARLGRLEERLERPIYRP